MKENHHEFTEIRFYQQLHDADYGHHRLLRLDAIPGRKFTCVGRRDIDRRPDHDGAERHDDVQECRPHQCPLPVPDARTLGIENPNGLPMGMQVLGYDSETVLPTVIITGRDGKIIWTHETDNYRVRPEPDVFLDVLRRHGVVAVA